MIAIFILGFLLVLNYTNIKRSSLYIVSVLILSVYALFFQPNKEFDLYRIYNMLERMRNIDLQETLIRFEIELQGLGVWAAFCHVVSRFQFNQAIFILAIISVYGAQFKLLSMAKEDFGISRRAERWVFAFIILTTDFVNVTTIRNIMVFTLFALVLYTDIVRKRKRILCWAVYVALMFFHNSAVVLVVFRLLMFLPLERNRLRYVVYAAVALWSLSLGWLIEVLADSSSPLLAAVHQRLVAYTTDERIEGWLGGFWVQTEFYIQLVIGLVTIAYYLLIRKSDRKEIMNSRWVVFLQMLAVFCLGGLANPVITRRFTPLLCIMASILYGANLNYSMRLESADTNTPSRRVCYIGIFLLMLANAAVQVVLCRYSLL